MRAMLARGARSVLQLPTARGAPYPRRFGSGGPMKALRSFAVVLAAALVCACSPGKKEAAAPGPQKTAIRFATDWRAEAEHGGFYEALANGEYAKRGLDVTLIQGGPGSNIPQQLAA